jgi:hypothetical protein
VEVRFAPAGKMTIHWHGQVRASMAAGEWSPGCEQAWSPRRTGAQLSSGRRPSLATGARAGAAAGTRVDVAVAEKRTKRGVRREMEKSERNRRRKEVRYLFLSNGLLKQFHLHRRSCRWSWLKKVFHL